MTTETATPSRNPLGLIFLTAFLDLLGLSLIIPILGPLLLKQQEVLGPEVPEATRNLVLGLMIGTFSLFQFFGSPLLGSVSDKVGRKPVLMGSMLLSVMGYLTVALGIWQGLLWVMFVGRAVQGFAAGNLSVLFSSIADISPANKKAQNFGLVGAAFGIGFVLGPLLGGVLSNPKILSWFTYTTPFLVGSGLVLLNFFQVWLRFPETNAEPNAAVKISPYTGIRNLVRAFTAPALRAIFVVVFLQTFGFTFFTQMVQVFLIEQFDYNTQNIGYLYGYIGLVIALTQGILVRIVSDRYPARKILIITLLALPLALLLPMLAQESYQLYFLMPFIAITQGLATPNISAIISNMAPPRLQGETLGMQQSVQALAQIIPPLAGGVIVTWSLTSPFWLSAVVVFLAWLAFVGQFGLKKPKASS